MKTKRISCTVVKNFSHLLMLMAADQAEYQRNLKGSSAAERTTPSRQRSIPKHGAAADAL